ncbi:uncharacterized protein LOC135689743 [Rhopilema esculentum]|uniref:uncharacterized protein LOC135689743 n=1 Tax=Rhopilema esculentum TaxID=499914 RepID=UPI0031D25A88|eukprot:gene8192-14124_t
MRTLLFVLIGLVAVYAAPAAEQNDMEEMVAKLDTEGYLSPVDVDDEEEVHMAKRLVSDETLEQLLLEKMEFIFKILGPLAPAQVKTAIRNIVNERKSEIVQALKQGGAALFNILVQIWRNALMGGLLG